VGLSPTTYKSTLSDEFHLGLVIWKTIIDLLKHICQPLKEFHELTTELEYKAQGTPDDCCQVRMAGHKNADNLEIRLHGVPQTVDFFACFEEP